MLAKLANIAISANMAISANSCQIAKYMYISSIHGGQPHIASLFTLYLCNIYAGLKNNRLYTLSQCENRFQWSKTQHGTL